MAKDDGHTGSNISFSAKVALIKLAQRPTPNPNLHWRVRESLSKNGLIESCIGPDPYKEGKTIVWWSISKYGRIHLEYLSIRNRIKRGF